MSDETEALERLSKLPMHEQRTTPWFQQRANRITASEAASCLRLTSGMLKAYYSAFPDAKLMNLGACGNPYTNYERFIQRKLDPEKYIFKGNEATRFGNFYEPIACDLYSRLHDNLKVKEYGFIEHPIHAFLGASPDGITEAGVMIEIKCPPIRQINGIPPFYYYVQMQLQLECCNLQYCDYIECKFVESQEAPLIDVWPHYGTILKNGRVLMQEILVDNDDVDKYYHLDKYFISRIARDQDFFNECLPQFKATFDDWMTRALTYTRDAPIVDPSLQFSL